ncbi:hypothetical protein EHQ81_02040 [Leptospira selangorensis]|uniref:Membrane-binding protein n=1 Tax=Leptospira selangorensis TaxID=2484982 RepID=A0A5F2BVK3_9LEPT|nr:hypothetical protein [Leptospira selangorensis]TGM11943.1 hypothetical protein EHQ82_20575 [Leptospira selangorensis]TGM15196.1 hypothetical protein EHQ81_02040 [Leptospira selangorensis]
MIKKIFSSLALFVFLFSSYFFLSNCSKPKPKSNPEIERLKPKKKADDRDQDSDISSREYFDEDADGKPIERKPEPSPGVNIRSFASGSPGCKKGNCKNGEGVYVYDTKDVYSGRFSGEMREGWGTLAYSDGDRYEGNWSDDKKSGAGRYVFRDGSVFSGSFTAEGNGNGKYTKAGRTARCRLENRKLFCK